MIYILENIDPREKCTDAVKKEGEMVHAFRGAPIVVDCAQMGSAAH